MAEVSLGGGGPAAVLAAGPAAVLVVGLLAAVLAGDRGGLLRGGLAGEELHALGDHVQPRAARAVVGLPLVELEPAADGDLAALGEVVRAGTGLALEALHVDEHGAVVAAPAVDRQPQVGDVGAVVGGDELGAAGEASDQAHVVHRGPPSPPLGRV